LTGEDSSCLITVLNTKAIISRFAINNLKGYYLFYSFQACLGEKEKEKPDTSVSGKAAMQYLSHAH
jgi:hypothetical protein